jgi:hypothetical protein
LRVGESELKEMFNVSEVSVRPIGDPSGISVANILIESVERVEGTRCDRCWNLYAETSSDRVRQVTLIVPAADAPWSVCGRCEKALTEMGYVKEAQ